MLLPPPYSFPQGVLLYTSVTPEFVCNAVGSRKTLPPSSLKSVKASASSTLENPLTCGAKEQSLVYHSWMLVDFHIWHYTEWLLGALVPAFCPPRRNVAAYGDRWDVACAQLCSSMKSNDQRHTEDIHSHVSTVQYQSSMWICSLHTGMYSKSALCVYVLSPSSSHSRCSFPSLTPSLQHHHTAR